VGARQRLFDHRVADVHSCVFAALLTQSGSYQFWCLNLLPEGGESTSQQARHVHLRYPEPFGNLGLSHIVEEPKLQNRLVAFWQRRQQRAHRFDVEHLVEIGV
jgi:hypothetical protein